MRTLLNYIAVIAAALMVLCILLQSRGQSLGMSFGGSSDTNFYRSKRGAEKILFNATIVFAVIFVAAVLLSLVAKS